MNVVFNKENLKRKKTENSILFNLLFQKGKDIAGIRSRMGFGI